jgi:hypothetical protein
MQPNTRKRREYKGKIYVKNIRKNSSRIRNQLKVGSGSGYGSEQIHYGTTTASRENGFLGSGSNKTAESGSEECLTKVIL